MYYTTTNNNPSAWICNPSDKGRKKIYLNSKVYLDNGSEFQIELFNPLNEAVLAELKINGKLASSTGIVLRPGERFYLDCFIDDKKKFIFKTYLSDGSSQGQAAIANNGFIEISFFKEKNKYQTYGTIDYNKSIAYYDYLAENLDKAIYYSEYVCENKDNTINYSDYLSKNTINSCGNVTNSVNLNNMVSSNTSSIDLNNTNFYKQTLNQPLFKTTNSSAKTIGKYPTGAKLPEAQVETGRIEKGNTSAQKFESVNMEFNTYCINKISYQLLPESKKPIETSEIKSNNNFCCNCGYKLKGGEKFCPSCGTKI
jgi:hypothetical protein